MQHPPQRLRENTEDNPLFFAFLCGGLSSGPRVRRTPSLPLSWCRLLLDVLANDANRGTATRGCEVGRRPEYALVVEAFGNIRPFFSQHTTGCAFQAIDQGGYRHFRRIADQQMHMVVLPVHLDQLRLKVSTDLGEQFAQPVDGCRIKHFAAIFRHKDQMYVHVKNAVSHASLRWFVPVRLQQGIGVAAGEAQGWRKEARLCRTVQSAHRMEGGAGNALAERSAKPSLATDTQESGTRLQKFLRETRRLSAIQEKRPIGQLPLSARHQTRSGVTGDEFP